MVHQYKTQLYKQIPKPGIAMDASIVKPFSFAMEVLYIESIYGKLGKIVNSITERIVENTMVTGTQRNKGP